jgi:phosphatidylinositol alpha-1,6-mannosyltransferase
MIKRLLITCEFPPITGGQGSYLKNLWSNLDPAENILLVPSVCKSTIKSAAESRFAFMPVSIGETWPLRLLRIKVLFFSMLMSCIKYEPGEIHAGQLIAGGICGLIIHFLFGIPYVIYCYGADLLEFSRYFWARPLIRSIFANSRRIITISRYTSGLIQHLYNPRTEIAIINPCVEDRFFVHDPALTENLRRRYALDNKKVVITIGRLVERKGHDTVIKALAILRKTVPAIHYLIVGDGPNRLFLENLAQSTGVSDVITFCGKATPDELPSYYRLGEIFIMVPRILQQKGDVEGFGIVYLEANAAGLPVVASRTGGIPDAVENGANGLIVNDPTDSAEIAAVLAELFSNDALRMTLSLTSEAWVKKFSPESQRKLWLEAIGCTAEFGLKSRAC